ncbi:MAG: hypothetical protein ACYC1D_12130 [Acidimicrobiales bacterium]
MGRGSGSATDRISRVRNAIRVLNQDDSDLYIGADRAGQLLEVVVLDDDGQLVAIHAMASDLSSTSISRGGNHAPNP